MMSHSLFAIGNSLDEAFYLSFGICDVNFFPFSSFTYFSSSAFITNANSSSSLCAVKHRKSHFDDIEGKIKATQPLALLAFWRSFVAFVDSVNTSTNRQDSPRMKDL